MLVVLVASTYSSHLWDITGMLIYHNGNQRRPNSRCYEPWVWHSLICVWTKKHQGPIAKSKKCCDPLGLATGLCTLGPLCVCVCVCWGGEKHTVIWRPYNSLPQRMRAIPNEHTHDEQCESWWCWHAHHLRRCHLQATTLFVPRRQKYPQAAAAGQLGR